MYTIETKWKGVTRRNLNTVACSRNHLNEVMDLQTFSINEVSPSLWMIYYLALNNCQPVPTVSLYHCSYMHRYWMISFLGASACLSTLLCGRLGGHYCTLVVWLWWRMQRSSQHSLQRFIHILLCNPPPPANAVINLISGLLCHRVKSYWAWSATP